MPECYVIAGPNGTSKTTFARVLLSNHARLYDMIVAETV